MLHFPAAIHCSIVKVGTTELTLSWDPREMEDLTRDAALAGAQGAKGTMPQEIVVLVGGRCWPYTTLKEQNLVRGKQEGEKAQPIAHLTHLSPGTEYRVMLQVGPFQSVPVCVRTQEATGTPSNSPSLRQPSVVVRSSRRAPPKVHSIGVQTGCAEEEAIVRLLDPQVEGYEEERKRIQGCLQEVEGLRRALRYERTDGKREVCHLAIEVERAKSGYEKAISPGQLQVAHRLKEVEGRSKALYQNVEEKEREVRRVREERSRLFREEATVRAKVEKLKGQVKRAERERQSRVEGVIERETRHVEEEYRGMEGQVKALEAQVAQLTQELKGGEDQRELQRIEERKAKVYARWEEIQRERTGEAAGESTLPRTEAELAQAIQKMEKGIEEKRRFQQGELLFVNKLWEEYQKEGGIEGVTRGAEGRKEGEREWERGEEGMGT
ncbi:MAG: hypothetical protein DHS80DRAFT_25205 [Piptocephalis tieghemiana]|nr:MAG: hypothetical protein DHS80DRAFT_25205 [Piptocephalis tieghemiana]